MKFNIGTILFDVNLDINDYVCVFYQDSASGKSFLFRALESFYCTDTNKYRVIDSRSANDSEDTLLSICSDYEIIAMDNADLYLTQSLYDRVCSLNKKLLISIHDLYKINFRSFGRYCIDFDETSLIVKRI